MTRPADSAPSIRRRLLLFLLPALVLLMLLNVYVSYRAHLLFVRQAVQASQAARAIQPAPTAQSAPVGRVTMDSTPAAGPGATAGGDAPAPAADAASQAAHFILASTWLMSFIQLDLTLLIVWLGVYFGLRPLQALRRQIEAGSPRELKHLDAGRVPAEVKPLVDALNLLFDTLAEAARSQRRFVADTAHQLRTPIAGLQGHLDLLLDDPAAAAVQGRLASLRDGMGQLSHSTSQLLALARADSSTGLATVFESVDLAALVGRVVELNVDRAAAAGIDLGAEVDPAGVDGASRLLEDLLGNLVDNALAYTPRGGTVTVRCAVAEGRPVLEVEDDGPGIPESERLRVRERFYRLPGSGGHGTGLGLAIVEEIAQVHGATLYIEAGAAGRGTRARVVFGAGG